MIIQKKSLADMIAETLKQQITEGTYRAGDKLPTEYWLTFIVPQPLICFRSSIAFTTAQIVL